jgi:hypothetical protein
VSSVETSSVLGACVIYAFSHSDKENKIEKKNAAVSSEMLWNLLMMDLFLVEIA